MTKLEELKAGWASAAYAAASAAWSAAGANAVDAARDAYQAELKKTEEEQMTKQNTKGTNMTIYIVFDTDQHDDPQVFTSSEEALDYYLIDTNFRTIKKVDLDNLTAQ